MWEGPVCLVYCMYARDLDRVIGTYVWFHFVWGEEIFVFFFYFLSCIVLGG